jgi:molybdopterin-guanine dinucleotide biosynthesis protein B
MRDHPAVFAVSGVKNSGKTTLICRLLEIFSEKGMKVATVKHDGHDFAADVPGTDTYRQLEAGAYGTVVFSSEKYMVVKRQKDTAAASLIELFPEADLILLEGFKYAPYPKIEIIRKGNSDRSVCRGFHLEAIATDLLPEEIAEEDRTVPILNLGNVQEIADFILERVRNGGIL